MTVIKVPGYHLVRVWQPYRQVAKKGPESLVCVGQQMRLPEKAAGSSCKAAPARVAERTTLLTP